MVKIIHANILNAPKGMIICQQVNCQNKMNLGLAKSIATRFPKVKDTYHEYCEGRTPESLLGEVQLIQTSEYMFANLFGQLTYGREGLHTDYIALRKALRHLAARLEVQTHKIAIPYNLGCGYAGGDWSIVYRIIKEELVNFSVTIYSLDPLDLKCGITERGDASINRKWEVNMMPNINIIISKRLTDIMIDSLVTHQDRVIFHHTVTGYGGTVLEKFVAPAEWSFEQCKKLIEKGFPAKQIVLRLDPVIPTKKGIATALNVLELYKTLGIKRVRFSFMDLYPHVQKRFTEQKIPLPWEGFRAPDEWMESFLYQIEGYKAIYEFESCAELTNYQVGCVSEKDYFILGLPLPNARGGHQRPACLCLGTKIELLDKPQPCAHNCIYCYWKDRAANAQF